MVKLAGKIVVVTGASSGMGRAAAIEFARRGAELVLATPLVNLAERPRRERHVPRIALAGIALHGLFPRFVERMLLHTLSAWHLGPEREDERSGGLAETTQGPAAVEGTRTPRLSTLGLFTWLAKHPLRIVVEPAPPVAK